jgi:hypothetical protein
MSKEIDTEHKRQYNRTMMKQLQQIIRKPEHMAYPTWSVLCFGLSNDRSRGSA